MTDTTNTFLLCEPDHFDVIYEINAWMDISEKPDQGLADAQWIEYKKVIEGCGGKVELIKQKPKLPDMVFTANGGLVKGNKCVLPRV